MVVQKLWELAIAIGNHSITFKTRQSSFYQIVIINSLIYKSIISHNNENNITILTQNVFDAIDSIRLKKKRRDLESISDHIEKTGFVEADKNSMEKAISELSLI